MEFLFPASPGFPEVVKIFQHVKGQLNQLCDDECAAKLVPLINYVWPAWLNSIHAVKSQRSLDKPFSLCFYPCLWNSSSASLPMLREHYITSQAEIFRDLLICCPKQYSISNSFYGSDDTLLQTAVLLDSKSGSDGHQAMNVKGACEDSK